jgi:curved DNA-binding protein CbpA
MSDFYAVLGVAKTADSQQIKTAFRALAKTCHPDLHGSGGNAEQRFKAIGAAYETLGNLETRASYDLARADGRNKARKRLRRAAATMSATFVLTVSSGLLAGLWVIGDSWL